MTGRAALRAVTLLGLDLLVLRLLVDLDVGAAAGLDDPRSQATELTLAVARLVGLALGGWLALVLFALLVASLPGLPVVLRRQVERRTRRGPAGLVRWAVGASTLALGVLPGPAAHAEAGPPVLAPLEDPTPLPPRIVPADPIGPEEGDPAQPSLRPAPPRAGEPPPRPPEAEPTGPPTGGPLGVETVIVTPGDSFWSVSERLLTRRLGRSPSDAEVVEPWLALIEANRDRLADPTDPDLLRPGQTLTVPPALG